MVTTTAIYYVVSEAKILHSNVDLEKLGRELGCLKPWEVLK